MSLFEADDSRAAEAEIFVRPLDLPTGSLKAAREAVALQLDILSPLPAEQTAFAVETVGPAEGGQTRFAVAFAPRGLFGPTPTIAAHGPAFVERQGELDGETYDFRFDNPYRRGADQGDRRKTLELVCAFAAGLVLVLGATSLRLGQSVERAQARLDATTDLVRFTSRQVRLQGDAQRVWRTAADQRHAMMIDCAFDTLAATGGEVVLTDLSAADGQVMAGLAQPMTPEQLAILTGKGARATNDNGNGAGNRVILDAEACQ
ncbi:hypothetical protein [Caulobacter sp. NIBR1757]|uniref:hypothetical protein n=1 Tax=Caulobacter sp. NIBR1757 TaxID=3016000 RepID=UPI0022EFFF32|nr:hypothetical protein [Caulobacter sp. NIBR1757]WGM40226.1 hypothetical protein AMEJIAPC_03167 [Caulobacter sp. NIBR1757]